MKFLDAQDYQPLAQEVFSRLRILIKEVLPAAQIEHIGSSSIQGVLSKGDLDIFVGVEPAHFTEATVALESLGFRIKHDSLRTESLCPFEFPNYPLDVGVQLVALGSRFEFFRLFRDQMNKNAKLRAAYNRLKKDAAGLNEAQYRELKSKFIENVLGQARSCSVSQPSD
jgi:GrpB-like predicted nucleotidyltransferase (UPF0157 family)